MKIALFKGTSCISHLIRWQTRSPYSHAAILFDDGAMVEAVGGVGVRHTTLAEAYGGKNEDIDIFEIEGLTPQGIQAAREFALAQVGKPYDYTMVIRFVTREQEARASAGKWFCSEYVFASASKAVELFRQTEPWEVSPALLPRSTTLKYSHTVRP